jgi:hypothetical protein
VLANDTVIANDTLTVLPLSHNAANGRAIQQVSGHFSKAADFDPAPFPNVTSRSRAHKLCARQRNKFVIREQFALTRYAYTDTARARPSPASFAGAKLLIAIPLLKTEASRRQAARTRPDHQDVDVPLHQALMTTHSAAKTARTRTDKIRELPSFLVQRRPSVPAVFSRMPTWRASIASTVADSAMHATAASRFGHLALNSLLR